MKNKTSTLSFGAVISVRGSAVDIRFDEHLSPIYSVLHAGDVWKSSLKCCRNSSHTGCAGRQWKTHRAHGLAADDAACFMSVTAADHKIAATAQVEYDCESVCVFTAMTEISIATGSTILSSNFLRRKIMSKIWILAANSGNATLFSADSPTAPLTELATFDNPDARAKQVDLVGDRPGRSFDSHGEGRHAMESKVEPKEQVQLRFAKLIADRLEQGRVDNAFGRLVLVAAPMFLGLLRANFGAPLSALVSMELDKDYTALRPEELRARLPEQL